MRRTFYTALLSLIWLLSIHAQYGNEWIDFDKTYYKFKIAEDGLYRIPKFVLTGAGLGDIPGSQFRLYHLGSEIPIYTTTDGNFSIADFIEFYGVRNRGELDRALFQQPDAEQLNPRYSMFTDSSTYFLTWDNEGQGLRFTGIMNDLSNPPAAESFYLHRDEWVYTDRPVDPRNASADATISYSRYQEGEGSASQDMSSFVLDIPASSIVAFGPDAVLDVRIVSSTFTGHDITALFLGDTLLNHGNSSGFHLYHLTTTKPAGSISTSQLLDIRDEFLNGRFAMATVQWTYPRQFDFTGRNTAQFYHSTTGAAQYFELNNFIHGGIDPVILDRNSGVRLLASRNGNTVRFLLPAFSGERDLVIISQAGAVHEVSALTETSFVDYSSDNTEYIIITHPVLRSGVDVVGQYAQYRSSTPSGGYHVNIYSILDLYDQFGYGIEKHPQAIRNFNKMIQDHWNTAKMVLIIGKGIVYTQSRQDGTEAEQNLLVPTFGSPGADHLLFTENGISLPPFPVGRLPIAEPEQLEAYLSKVIEYDLVKSLPQTIADRAWTKHILHMGGGGDASQQEQILDLLNQMASNAINSEFGAEVFTFSKSSTNATSQSNSDRILEILRNGTSIVKFFGHSSASTLDFQINTPQDWKNKGKYPIFSAMGCKAGDIHQNFLSLSERFVFEPEAGTIAFVAGSGSQYLSTLGNWGQDWYLTFGHGVNTLTLGESILESLSSLNQFGTLSSVLLIEQQTLTGDPAMRFYSTPGPDYLWDFQSVKHDPEVLTTNDPSFTLSADVVNIGTNFPDTLLARVEQKLPDGALHEVYFDTVYLSTFRTTLNFEIPIERTSSGLNTFYLTIDALNETVELPDPAAEENNELTDASGKRGIDIFILDNRARTTYPFEFSIVTEQNPELIASSTNAFVKGATFVMELDTTPGFNSPLRLQEFFTGFGSVLRWKPIFNFIPGRVYYWRVSTANDNERIWDSSSFLFNPGGQRGWNQSHYGQFQKDILVNLDFDHHNRLSFDTIYRNIWVQNKLDTDPELADDPVVYINSTLRRDFFTFYSGYDAHVFAIVIDSFSGRFLRNDPGGLYGSVNPSANTLVVFPYNTSSPEGRNGLMTFLTDVVTDGMYVILYTYQRPNYMDYFPEVWANDEQATGRSIFSVIESQASGSQIRTLANTGSVPYLLFYRKNFELIYEGIANQPEETISFDYNFISHANAGDLISTLIGPARKWQAFEWDFLTSAIPANDMVSAQLIVLSKTMTDTLVYDVTTVRDTTLDFIDATEYPYLLLTFHTADQPDLTAARVDYWRVLYEGMPDLLLNPAGGYEFEKDSLYVGQSMNLTTGVENLGADLTETTQVRFTITDSQNNTQVLYEEIPPLASGESTLVHVSQQQMGIAGRSSLLVEVNYDRRVEETSYLNNTGILNFIVLADTHNPVLDVTFDGRHLVNGDIVSSEPAIRAELRDDNAFLLLDDRAAFEVLMRYPNDFDYTWIDINGPKIAFEPAISGAQNIATLTYRPVLDDGFYDLIIRAHDRSMNDAGDIEYAISFEVLGDRLISRVDAQPRWFNDHTRFIFTISGTQIPSSIQLDISNTAGQIVREIGKDEIGLFVGTTEYVWDGTTDSGERLPGGVYFYRLTAKDQDGNDYDLLGPGFGATRDGRVGKVVIIR
ncbi:MAG TPA: C25 family cysteine peptidase [Saprospiraceae bacterium]|nr:C25 family cysteine peptidase [Saprospiraceae bacterium]